VIVGDPGGRGVGASPAVVVCDTLSDGNLTWSVIKDRQSPVLLIPIHRTGLGAEAGAGALAGADAAG